MNKQNIQRKLKNRTLMVSIRITPKIQKWLKKNNYSQTSIFHEAIKELGFK